MSTLLDYDDLCQRYGLSRRYVRDTLIQPTSQRLVRWRAPILNKKQ